MGLPRPLGPCEVAFGDFELRRTAVPGENGDQTLKKTGELSPYEGSTQPPLLRIFYPTAKKPPKCCLTAGRHWLPNIMYMYGYCTITATSLDWPNTVKCWAAALAAFCFVNPQAIINASVRRPPLPAISEGGDGVEKDGKLPVIIFSHGLWAMRTTYTTYCCDLASHGYVVAVLEHLDGSACMAQCTLPDGSIKWIHHDPIGVDLSEVSNEIRARQLKQRVKEIQSVLGLLEEMAAGNIDDSANAVKGPSRLRPSCLVGRLDTRQVAVVGHSFGGVTASLVADAEPKATCCIALDAWWTPLISGNMPGTAGDRPLLAIDNSLFGGAALESARRTYFARRRKACPAAVTEYLIIQGSKHQDMSDLPLILPTISQKSGTSGPLGGFKTREIISRASLEFLLEHFLQPDQGFPYEASLTDEDKSHVVVQDIDSF